MILSKSPKIFKSCLYFTFTFLILLQVSFGAEKKQIDLSGQWSFKIDRENVGVSDKWFNTDLPYKINLPGSLQEQGYGNDITAKTGWIADSSGVGPMTDAEMGYDQVEAKSKYPGWFVHPMYEKYRQPENLKFPYWLQPEKHYVGQAWYQKEFNIPQQWQDQRVTLTLERCHWKSDVWLNGSKVGTNDSLVSSHVYDLTDFISLGTNKLTVRVDNSMIFDVGYNSHIVSDHTQSAWNGIIGKIALEAEPLIGIENVQVYPDIESKSARVKFKIFNHTNQKAQVALRLSAESYNSDKKHKPKPLSTEITASVGELYVNSVYPMSDNVQLWDEFNPALYNLTVELIPSDNKINKTSREVSFGMREVGTNGTRVSINGEDIFLRGIEECCIFPNTGYPPTDVESWRRIMKISKKWGMNHLRFHSWCPPKAAFQAADMEGVYVEVSFFWARFEEEPVYRFLRREARRAMKQYGNHPSFILLSPGQECWMASKDILEMFRDWKTDPRRLYSGPGNSNWLITPEIEKEYEYYAARHYEGHRTRYQAGWPPEADGAYFTSMPPQTVIDYEEAVKAFGKKPLMTYEVVQRCSYPNLDSGHKYTGQFDAAYLDIARDQLKERGMLEQADNFVTASGKWQVKQFKEEIEAALRTKGVAGFQLLGIQDFPGQGAALVGIIDAFWDNKGYVSEEKFGQFCDVTVPLARMEKRVWKQSETFKAGIEIANFSQQKYNNAGIICRVKSDQGKVIEELELAKMDILIGNGFKAGNFEADLADYDLGKYVLEVQLADTNYKNTWDFWVYPDQVNMPSADDIYITNKFDETTRQRLEAGGKVLLLAKRDDVAGDMPQCFSSIYWNCPWTGGGESQTMGILCKPQHKLFEYFPTDFHSNWQWYELLIDARPMILDQWDKEKSWPKEYRPLVQLINDWNTNKKLAVLAECKYGKGKMVISSMNLENDLDNRFVARQFRYSLLNYMKSSEFDPQTKVSKQQINGLFKSD
ncbi:Beta-galactosidase large subunit [Sedimentisphaera cyanobacteriorum]|uniref:beta-galactosidase n=1 Tax=Sedimentisphaera cyanobacteriorum TaxID=1940790 RepID=A0A1Q2HMT8_9BACT|nr:sugar-binding domain-containing protein [Sedimentisphaera cyanobacteriorum]AQQ08595.1 Beta-galactosidase large subunit [Sedimentisphaera cyanobacteriorum]